MRFELQVFYRRVMRIAERVEFRVFMSTNAKCIDQAEHTGLLVVRVGRVRGCSAGALQEL